LNNVVCFVEPSNDGKKIELFWKENEMERGEQGEIK
jgi:hypothetical protein